MTEPAFTILLPVHRPPAMLPYAIASVQAQRRRDFELFVICDGAPPETAETARRFAADDPRIRVFEHPKGARHGEAYRDQALRQARGRFVCQLGDDDLWLPNHLDEMAKLLEEVDFGNLPHVQVKPDGSLSILPGSLADADVRHAMLTEHFGLFGPTVAGYRIEAYRALPVGWAPAPPDIVTDLFMWRKFLAQPGLRFGSRIAVTSLKFTAAYRGDWPLEQRRAEVAAWAARLSDPDECDRIAQSALLALSRSALTLTRRNKAQRVAAQARKAAQAKLSRKLQKMRQSWSWRLTRPFRALARRMTRREKD
jgi:glycosyltransferase involved in cell wall biosynthesis